MKPKKRSVISDDMIGQADPVCFCAAQVADIIRKKNQGSGKQGSMRKLKERIEKKRAGS